MENELKEKGYAIVEKDGIAYLHLTSQLNLTMFASETVRDSIIEKMDKYKAFKFIVH